LTHNDLMRIVTFVCLEIEFSQFWLH
jgi:hypothetical protein